MAVDDVTRHLMSLQCSKMLALFNFRVVDKMPMVKRDPEAVVTIRGFMYKQVCGIDYVAL